MGLPHRLSAEDEMVTLPAKSIVSILSAIKNLQEQKGSSAREIINYVSAVHHIPPEVVKRRMHTVLKRGVAHGILREVDGRYSLPIDTEMESLEIAEQELGLLDFCSRMRERKRQARKSKRTMLKRKTRTHMSRSRWGKSVCQIKPGKRMLGTKKKSESKKTSTKTTAIREIPKIIENNSMQATPLEQGVKRNKKIRLETSTPCTSRNSCVREIGLETLPVV